MLRGFHIWCLGAESNHRHADFQSAALPTELPRLHSVVLLKKRYHQEGWCLGAESNHRHADFQSAALPTELPRPFTTFRTRVCARRIKRISPV